jgi:hypothetical protein
VEKDDRIYLLRLVVALLVYLIVLTISVRVVAAHPFAPWRLIVAVTPVLPALYTMMAFIYYLSCLDELQRRIHLEAIAFAFGGTAIVTFGYGFLENAGLPHLSWHYVWPFMTFLWAIGLLIANRRY